MTTRQGEGALEGLPNYTIVRINSSHGSNSTICLVTRYQQVGYIFANTHDVYVRGNFIDLDGCPFTIENMVRYLDVEKRYRPTFQNIFNVLIENDEQKRDNGG